MTKFDYLREIRMSKIDISKVKTLLKEYRQSFDENILTKLRNELTREDGDVGYVDWGFDEVTVEYPDLINHSQKNKKVNTEVVIGYDVWVEAYSTPDSGEVHVYSPQCTISAGGTVIAGPSAMIPESEDVWRAHFSTVDSIPNSAKIESIFMDNQYHFTTVKEIAALPPRTGAREEEENPIPVDFLCDFDAYWTIDHDDDEIVVKATKRDRESELIGDPIAKLYRYGENEPFTKETMDQDDGEYERKFEFDAMIDRVTVEFCFKSRKNCSYSRKCKSKTATRVTR